MRDPVIEDRLIEWGEWMRTGDGSGFSTMSVLHHDWMPPSGGITPTLKLPKSNKVTQVHAAVELLSLRLRNTLVMHYCLRSPLADQALRLECCESTVRARIVQSHYLLRQHLKQR